MNIKRIDNESIKNVGIVSLGCAKNQVDAEVMLGLLKNAGYNLVNESKDADIIIINTCGFIKSAQQESVETILEQCKYKELGRCRYVIVTGCLAERYKDELLKEIPEIDGVVGTYRYPDIIEVIKDIEEGTRKSYEGKAILDVEQLPRVITTNPGTAYLKIAEGCDNHCSYCIIPKLRGKYKSRNLNSLVDEANDLAEKGVKELIVVAQDVTRYGQDLNDGTDLIKLLRELCGISNLKWIRLLYCYPEYVTDELLELIAKEDKICSYFDIPLQHVHPNIVRRMNRRFAKEQIAQLMDKIRSTIPDAVIRTTFITGFPGESDEEFEMLKDFIQEHPFNHIGVFPYSREEGTPAALFDEQIDERTKIIRKNILMGIQRRISKRFNRQRVGKIYDVLIEGLDSPGVYIGRSYGEAPEVDGKIFVMSSEKLKTGQFIKVKITKAYDYDLLGEHYEFSE